MAKCRRGVETRHALPGLKVARTDGIRAVQPVSSTFSADDARTSDRHADAVKAPTVPAGWQGTLPAMRQNRDMVTTGGTRASRRSRGALALALYLYAMCALAFLLGVWTLVNTAEDTCTFGKGDSGGGGTASWSWVPLGQQCTYDITLEGVGGPPVAVTHVDPPSPFITTTLVLLVVTPVVGGLAWRAGPRSN